MRHTKLATREPRLLRGPHAAHGSTPSAGHCSSDAIRAVQLFKRALLGIVTRRAASGACLTPECSGVDESQWVAQGTWANWAPWPRAGSTCVARAVRCSSGGHPNGADPATVRKVRWPEGFFSEMVRGGLLRSMVEAACRSTSMRVGCAAEYQPLSAWHLHLDAPEAAAYLEIANNAGLTVKLTNGSGGSAVIDGGLWGQRHGLIYRELSGGEAAAGQLAAARGRMVRDSCWGATRRRSMRHDASRYWSTRPRCRRSPGGVGPGPATVTWPPGNGCGAIGPMRSRPRPYRRLLVAWLGLVQLFYMGRKTR